MKPAFLVIDKPAGITSHDVVAMARAVLGVKKVGHTGTLDPFATGVLPLALGPATRLIQFLDEDIKIYEAVIGLGAATDTGDPTGEVIRELPVPDLDEAGVTEVLDGFAGVRMQAPPRHSAVKINGRPSYAYAREGKDVRAAPRPVRIDGIDLVKLDGDRLSVRIRCGRGTYARVLADEIATELGTAGHLVELRRTRSGPFAIDGALTLEQLSVFAADREDWQNVLRRRRDGERVQWKPRDQVRDGVSPWIVRPVDALSHLPTAPREGDAVLAPAPEGTQPGQRYLVVDGDDVISVAALEEEGPQLLRKLRGRR